MDNDHPALGAQGDTHPHQAPRLPLLTRLICGPNGLRAGWRVLTFSVVLVSLVWSLLLAIRVLLKLIHFQRSAVLSPGRAILSETIIMVGLFVTTAIFARTEKRSFGEYGLPAHSAFGTKFCEGLVWGFAGITAILLVLRATGNFYFGTISLPARTIAAFAAAWSVYFVLVGVAEEFAFRGYPLFTLARGMGFWPAAGLMASLFGGVHLLNSGENWVGAASIVLASPLLALTLRRTGDLWFAIGLHAAWDWGESFFYGVPDSGTSFSAHLLTPSFHGSKWMTGGSVGPEASVIALLGYGVLFFLLHFRFPQMAPENPPRQSIYVQQ
jgi:membrane protease YdiL (CAAX protease family)